MEPLYRSVIVLVLLWPGYGSASEPSEAYQLPSLILCVYSATERTKEFWTDQSNTCKTLLSQSNAEILR